MGTVVEAAGMGTAVEVAGRVTAAEADGAVAPWQRRVMAAAAGVGISA